MPRPVRVGLVIGVATLLAAGAIGWTLRGPAILLDLTTGAARLLCL